LKQHNSIIYVPGLGDKNLRNRQKLLNLWHFRNVSIELCSMQWSVAEPWQDKLQRLLNRIEECNQAGSSVTLVGESAGASAVVNALKKTDAIDAVVLLCGKSRYPNRVAQYRYKQNPRLQDALTDSDQIARSLSNEQKQKILNLHPLFDPVVPVPETRISGVKNSTMPIIGHATSIVFANTLWSWRIVRFARRQS
jgi:hypothetical protein